MSNLLSLMTFFPLVGMVVLLFLPRESDRLLKTVTLVITLITFADQSAAGIRRCFPHLGRDALCRILPSGSASVITSA